MSRRALWIAWTSGLVIGSLAMTARADDEPPAPPTPPDTPPQDGPRGHRPDPTPPPAYQDDAPAPSNLPVTGVVRRRDDPRIAMPELLRSPTGWMLPAAVFYAKTSLDTGGGVSSNARVGLGDVAEFGVTTTDDVRAKQLDTDDTHRIQPYVTATFRMGVGEDRLFRGQPAVALGFEKSFERKLEGFATRTAQLTLVASERLGTHFAFHVGAAFWDASLSGHGEQGTKLPDDGFDDAKLHDRGLGRQIVPFGGIQIEAKERSEILIDFSWAPLFCYQCAIADQIQLQPELSWGVRYQVSDWCNIESGVRLPNIGKADLLDAQIFGSITFASWSAHRAIEGLR